MSSAGQGERPEMTAQFRLSLAVILVGVLLMVYMITVEDEPGGIPVLLVLGGTAWHLITRARARRAT